MSNTPVTQSAHALLRQKAETSLRGGKPPVTSGWTIGPASLALLHQLASNPETAGDALKLLHELQVHQVELDLQHEHMNEERLSIEQLSLRQVQLYVFAPVAYFMVDSTGQVAEGNLLAARMMSVNPVDLPGQNIDRLCDPDSRPALLSVLAQVRSSGLGHRCRVQAMDTSRQRWLDVIASASPGGQHCLVVMLDRTEPEPAQPALATMLIDPP